MKNTIPLSVPCVDEREIEYVSRCISDNWVSTAGQFVTDFEDELAIYTGVRHAIAVNSGTSALHLALLALGVDERDEVLVPALTFIASANVVRYVGADPVFMDCDETLNVDPKKVIRFFSEECEFDGEQLTNRESGRRVSAIVVVHVLGCPVNISPILDVCKMYNVRIIEDAAESLEDIAEIGRKRLLPGRDRVGRPRSGDSEPPLEGGGSWGISPFYGFRVWFSPWGLSFMSPDVCSGSPCHTFCAST